MIISFAKQVAVRNACKMDGVAGATPNMQRDTTLQMVRYRPTF